jgi:hypothetical protein
MYGYFYSSFGIPFQRYTPKDFFAGTFNGTEPFANRWLFRAFTAYKQLMPEMLQHNINEHYIYSTLKRSVGDARQARTLLQ